MLAQQPSATPRTGSNAPTAADSWGRRVKAEPGETLEREVPHLAFFKPSYYDRVVETVGARNAKYRRSANGQPDGRRNVPRKRTRFPGQCVYCGICGRLYWGLYHQPRHGRPALALDLMEPLRPLLADSAVVTAINTGMVRARHFKHGRSACLLQPAGRKAMIQAFESRLDQLVTHPAFDYRCSWRAAIRLHARLLARFLRADVPRYLSITTR